VASNPKLFTRLFILVWFAGLLQELAWSVMVHFPGFLSGLGASETRIGLLYSLSAVAGLALRPMLGRVMDNMGRRPVLLGAGIGNAVAVAAMASATSISPLLVILFVGHRIFQIAIFTAMLTLSADVLPEARRTEGLAIFGLGGLLPLATGGAIGDLLLRWGDFALLFLVAATISMMSWLLVWFVPRQPAAASDGLRRGFFSALGQRNLLPLWLLTLLFAAGLEALFTFIRTYVDDRQIGSVGGFFLVYGGVAMVVRIASSSRLDRFPQLPLVVASTLCFAVGLMGLGLASAAHHVSVAAACLGAGHGLLFPILTAQVVTRAREAERGSAMAIFTSLFDLAVLTAAPVVGVVIDRLGYTVAFVGVAVFVTAGIVVYAVWDMALDRKSVSRLS
jgi:predicted MFS family arabinose efflux permease